MKTIQKERPLNSIRFLYVVAFIVPAICHVYPAPASAAVYSITDLGTLGGTFSAGKGINASGQVTGLSTSVDGQYHAFIYDGIMRDVGLPGFSYATAINDAGNITGFYVAPNGSNHPILFDGTVHEIATFPASPYPKGGIGLGINNHNQVTGNLDFEISSIAGLFSYQGAFLFDGSLHGLGTPQNPSSSGFGINDNGQVTGSSNNHAYLYDGVMHDLGTLGGPESEGFAINSLGQITGISLVAEGSEFEHAFFYDGTVMHDLGTLSGMDSSAGQGINIHGQITGYSYRLGVSSHAFIYDPAHGMVDLNSLIDPNSGWVLAEGTAINDGGLITGDGVINGETHAFLLTPISVPETRAIVFAAFSLLIIPFAFILRRQRQLAMEGDPRSTKNDRMD